MSSSPYTSLTVNPRGIETFEFNDYIYLMAPALQGGVLLDDFGLPVVNNAGETTLAPKIIGNIEACEREFGLATAGSPMSIYARWILDRVQVPIICRRVVGSSLANAQLVLKNNENMPIIWLESKTQTEVANKIMLDVSESSLCEFFFKQPNATFITEQNILHLEADYTGSQKIIFDGVYSSKPFHAIATTQAGVKDYNLFDFELIAIEDENKQYVRMFDGIAESDLQGNQFSYHSATNEVSFGAPPSAGFYTLLVHGQDSLNNPIKLFLSPDGVSQTYKINFEINSVQFNNLFINGVATKNDETEFKIARIYSLKSAATQDISVRCTPGTISNTMKLTVTGALKDGTTVIEIFDDLISYRDLILRINNVTTGSKLIRGELWMENFADIQVPSTENTKLLKVGFQATLYIDGYTETYDNLKDVSQFQFELNYKSLLVRAAVLNQANTSIPKLGAIGLRLKNGDSGLNPTTVDYLDALAEAEKINYITVMIAPGVADENFHILMKNHCHEMYKVGKYRTSIVGGKLNETSDIKKQRAALLSHERISLIGDGLKLISPVTGEPEMFSPAICTAAFTAQLLSEYYFVSQTHKIMNSAKGVEHTYDAAQLEDLHNGRMILFQNTKFGVQIVDGITTSPLNAYEDMHMVRVFDTISRNVKNIMENNIGRNNMPITWAYVSSIVRKLLDIMKDSDAIQDYRFISQVEPQDLIDRRYKFKLGIVPAFPVKYVEGYIDIFPPYAIETQ